MFIDSLLFNLIVMRSKLSDFSSQYSHLTKSHQRWSPLWWWVDLAKLCVQGSEWPSTSRVILCQWHSINLITNNCTILFGLLSIHLHRFQVIDVMFMFTLPLLMIVYLQLFSQQCCV